jgi:hypothetical protein
VGEETSAVAVDTARSRQSESFAAAALLLLAVTLAGVAAWVWLHQAAQLLDDDQRFSRSGWAGIVPAGVYAVGVLLLAGWLLGVLFRLLGRIGRRLRPT